MPKVTQVANPALDRWHVMVFRLRRTKNGTVPAVGSEMQFVREDSMESERQENHRSLRGLHGPGTC